MTKKVFCLIVMLAVLLLKTVLPATAQGRIPNVYVDERLSEGNESGTQENPYNTEEEGRAYAQSLPYGARLHITHGDGSTKTIKVDPCYTTWQGVPLPRAVLYIFLAILALVLILVGWQLRRRAHQLQG